MGTRKELQARKEYSEAVPIRDWSELQFAVSILHWPEPNAQTYVTECTVDLHFLRLRMNFVVISDKN